MDYIRIIYGSERDYLPLKSIQMVKGWWRESLGI